MRFRAVARVAAALALLASAGRAQTTTVIVVRHAEKNAEPAADPELSTSGAARAQALADMVRSAHVQAVISTQFQRTRQTAAPTAGALGLSTEIVDARAPQHARLVADSILTRHRGQTVLVVGHSNTVPDIVAALGAPRPADICDAGYDNMFVVTVPASGPASVTQLHYGAKASCP